MERKIRNIAVVAHVDHGKTTLIDAMLKQTHIFRENEVEMAMERILDSNDQERERGITILAKNCSISYKGVKINIIDTPGHADFSGEVERTLSMADGALLIVDAADGPMPQTRFVLKKALELNLKIIVVINKIDKKYARVKEVIKKVESLFLELAKKDSHLDFSIIYAIGRRGVTFSQLPSDINQEGDVTPLLDLIVSEIPEPQGNSTKIFKMLVSSLDYDPHVGRIAIGKIAQGKVAVGQKVILTSKPGKIWRVEKLMTAKGLGKENISEANCGAIVSIVGVEDAQIGQTLSDPADNTPLAALSISEPTLHMTLGANTSPFSGREGKFTTSRQIGLRLQKELESNLSLKVESLNNGKFKISGKGELHLAILLETLRREGYEMEVGKPEVITKVEGEIKVEPVEEVDVIVPNEFVGIINQEFGKRLAKLQKMEPINAGETEFIYNMPTRAIIGLRSILLTQTKGTVIFSSVLTGFEQIGKPLAKLRRGALISATNGEVLAYGLENAQGRGLTFVEPQTLVYEGMIIGLNAKDEDVSINICKGKKLTNMRSKSSDGIIQLAPPVALSLEQSLDFLESDELLEITPASIRLRKRELTELDRKRQRHAANEIALITG
ncbi:GTP-binding protein TypA [Candidatus Woesebacteria bacterium RIFCSPLOWO2_01_FULL_39_61]|uniref:50S ribosomal subunit assembly factor BipA n=1 Tax=Candidatus Woesebacteria bacterium RIFCSPHIGHO2_02_FULL_39_13 TaxID=1802505 RepID=A0A1F7Z5L5_9BACT|nr:MAG: GTP-binding protein TypA [Candidatus Woesebacteria bacterium RIFCSPHIGHO2_01_FULL_39_95]OGM34906.1 MAG: GTP-binding protein TypA [Candidatus Woesebacteria bacterium RIFCSPHIGHO2_02_FULL_39_13]OGM37993.1 MAG: GTP-binding protein TypA [Candidatus Woesebacteria bacterium RIFCSPHIGHO2_12_FULL_40_20]OGM66609.1 MAG: GTP-binding protein TypA [Candidatus Woesebacteria bacterium RIFCSPLOWO2_01_FULL_39_61]